MVKEIKIILWKMMGRGLQQKYSFVKLKKTYEYQTLKYNCCKKRFILLDTPEHGNLGDHAIVYAIKKFVASYNPDYELIEFSFSECRYCLNEISKLVKCDDIILLPGGGFLGNLWMEEEENFLNILQKFKDHKIIVFPQTIFFMNTNNKKRELKKFYDTLAGCKNLFLFLRDWDSYCFAENMGRDVLSDFKLVPDIVTWLKYKRSEDSFRKEIVLFCLRSDKEKIIKENELKKCQDELKKKGYEIVCTSTVLNDDIRKELRDKKLACKLKQFAESKLVITDRLHGMLFSAVTSTPCIAMDNLSHKVSGGYEWLKYLDYIKLVRQEDITMKLIEQMIKYEGEGYNNKPLQVYYKQIRNVITDALGS